MSKASEARKWEVEQEIISIVRFNYNRLSLYEDELEALGGELSRLHLMEGAKED